MWCDSTLFNITLLVVGYFAKIFGKNSFQYFWVYILVYSLLYIILQNYTFNKFLFVSVCHNLVKKITSEKDSG